MGLFTFFPKVNYKVNDYDYLRAIDITTTYKIKNFFKNYRGINYRPYVIKDGENPYNVSQTFYGTPDYDWIILLANDIYNIYDEWPKDSLTFEKYIIEKYGSISAASSTIKYYYDADGDIIDLTTYNSLTSSQKNSESILQYEQRLNDNKSIIRVINASLVSTIRSELNTLNIKPIT